MGAIHDIICKGGCTRCHGSGLIDDGSEGGAWCHYAELPMGSDLAVRLGVVKAIPCPDCQRGVTDGGRRLNIRETGNMRQAGEIPSDGAAFLVPDTKAK